MRFKRLFFDIEVSDMDCNGIWRPGEQYIRPDQITRYPKIICICYKWEGQKTIYYLTWKKGDDKEMILQFYDNITEADEVVGHNGDNYDIKWVRTRALFHGIKNFPEIKSIDTLKVARQKLKLPSNKLDEIAAYFGLRRKVKTRGMEMWRDVIDKNCPKALVEMVDYCCGDVTLLEEVYQKFSGLMKPKTHLGIFHGNYKWDCPHCSQSDAIKQRTMVSPAGSIKCAMWCKHGCGKYFQIPLKAYLDRENSKKNKGHLLKKY